MGTRIFDFWSFFVGSLAVAAASAGIPYLTNRDDFFLILKIVVPLGLCWLVLLGMALRLFRWRGLWLLLGAPLTFWWPFAFVMILSACAHNVRACP